ADAGALARFRGEAELIARLAHPNIIQVHEIGTCPAGPYFVMELAAGGSLADYWEAHPLTPTEAAVLVATLARAVHHAHEAGIVHRDLKPANILLSRMGNGEWGLGMEEAPAPLAKGSPGAPSSSIPIPHSPFPIRGPFPIRELVSRVKITDFGLARYL